MKPSPFARRVGLTAALFGWGFLAFWALSLSYSASFFQYDVASRLPPFLAAFTGAIAIPVSGYYQLHRVRRGHCTAVRGWLLHVCGSIAAVLPLAATVAVLSRVPGPMHLSGDDAMGVGLDFALLVGVEILSALVLAVALLLQRRSASRAA